MASRDNHCVYNRGQYPVLAQELLKLLFHIDGGNNKDSHQWPDSSKNITVKNQIRSQYDVTINVRDFVEYISENANLEKAVSDPLFSENEDLLRKMAEAETPVNVYDETTWNGVDYTPIADIIHKAAGAALSQGQMIESLFRELVGRRKTIVVRLSVLVWRLLIHLLSGRLMISQLRRNANQLTMLLRGARSEE